MINFLHSNRKKFFGLFALIGILCLTKIVFDRYFLKPPVEVSLDNKGGIYGRVINKNTNKPIVGAIISLHWKTPYYRPPRSPFDVDSENQKYFESIKSDNNGNYHFVFDIPPEMRKKAQFIICIYINRENEKQLSCDNRIDLGKRIDSDGTDMIFRSDFSVNLSGKI